MSKRFTLATAIRMVGKLYAKEGCIMAPNGSKPLASGQNLMKRDEKRIAMENADNSQYAISQMISKMYLTKKIPEKGGMSDYHQRLLEQEAENSDKILISAQKNTFTSRFYEDKGSPKYKPFMTHTFKSNLNF